MHRIKHLWAHHRIMLVAFIGTLAVIVFFSVKTTAAMIYWMDPAHQDQELASWMTPRYIAQSYKLPPDVLGPALFLEKDMPPMRMSLGMIADEHNMSMGDMQARIDAAAAAWRAAQDKTR
tara:strand:+ start:21672 stop:22031 length:360 start_codon:yes stop_codon:yes gene_type:complete